MPPCVNGAYISINFEISVFQPISYAVPLQESVLFGVVVMATVSSTPDIKRIQQKIAEMLRQKLDEADESTRASHLHHLLTKKEEKKILKILDDVWEVLD